jgi:hypothetical protein
VLLAGNNQSGYRYVQAYGSKGQYRVRRPPYRVLPREPWALTLVCRRRWSMATCLRATSGPAHKSSTTPLTRRYSLQSTRRGYYGASDRLG